jgi:hypothetical protein
MSDDKKKPIPDASSGGLGSGGVDVQTGEVEK